MPRSWPTPCLEYWERYPPAGIPELPARDYLLRIVPLVRERLKTLADAAPLVSFLFADEVEYDSRELVQKGMDDDSTKGALQAAQAALQDVEEFQAESIEAVLRALAAELGIKGRAATRLSPRRDHGTEGVTAPVRDPRAARPGALPRRDPNRGRPAVGYAHGPASAGRPDVTRSSEKQGACANEAERTGRPGG